MPKPPRRNTRFNEQISSKLKIEISNDDNFTLDDSLKNYGSNRNNSNQRFISISDKSKFNIGNQNDVILLHILIINIFEKKAKITLIYN